MKVIIAPRACGLSLSRACLDELFERRPELFNEPFPAEELRLEGQSDADMLAWHANAVLRDGKVHFLKVKDCRVRTDVLLLALLETRGEGALRSADCDLLKVVEVPDDVNWYVHSDSDGSESIHETHRVWQ